MGVEARGKQRCVIHRFREMFQYSAVLRLPKCSYEKLTWPKNHHRAVSMSITPIIDSSSSAAKVQQRSRRSLNETQVSHPIKELQSLSSIGASKSHPFPFDLGHPKILNVTVQGHRYSQFSLGLGLQQTSNTHPTISPSLPPSHGQVHALTYLPTPRILAAQLTPAPSVPNWSPQNTPPVPTFLQHGPTSKIASSPIWLPTRR